MVGTHRSCCVGWLSREPRDHETVSTESPWPELPPRLPWQIHDGPAMVERDGRLIRGIARAWFTVQDKPTVRYEFAAGPSENDGASAFLGSEPTLIVDGELGTDLLPCDEGARSSGWYSNGRANELCIEGDVSDLVGGDGSQLSLLRFHLVNFGDEVEVTPRRFDVDGWAVRIAPLDSMPRLNGFAVTHVLDLCRSDWAAFSVDDASEPRRWLFDALTFAAAEPVKG